MNVGKKQCYFCKNNVKYIDYKSPDVFKRFMTNWGRIKSGSITGVCTKHQRQLGKAIKRARFLALVPYVSR